jgi:hypothetical protein
VFRLPRKDVGGELANSVSIMTDNTSTPNRIISLSLPKELETAINAVCVAAGPTSSEKRDVGDVCCSLLVDGLKAWARDRGQPDFFHLAEWRRLVRWFEDNPAIARLSPDDLDENSPERVALVVLLEETADFLGFDDKAAKAEAERGVAREEAVEQLAALEEWAAQTAEAVRLIGQLS